MMNEEAKSSSPETKPRGARWWPLVVILVASVVAYAALWFIPERSQQHFNLNVARVVLFTLGALLVWLLALSRLRWRLRFAVLGCGVAGVGLLAALFRIHGVDGNLVPILEFRWTHRELAVPATAPTNAPASVVAGAADFTQFLGPARDGALVGPRLATNWTAQPPTLQWRQPVGAAWSGFVVAGSIAITQEQRGENEFVVAYDLVTGRALWSHADPVRYFTTLAGEGPRATPTIVGQRVFAQGATGWLNCLDLATGRVLWAKDILKENDGGVPDWGFSSSPLVVDDLVVVNPGGSNNRSLVAYRVEDGAVRWAAGKRGESYSSPLVEMIGGTRQVLIFSSALVGHDAATGEVLWEYRWPGGHPHIAMPLRVSATDWIVSSGYGTGSGRVSVSRDSSGKWSAKQVWRTNRMKAKFTNLVLHRNHVYGLDDGIMACLDAKTGDLKWKDGKYGHGQVLLVGELLLVMAESGDVVLLDPSQDGLRELTRFTALTGKTWNPPALAGEYLLVRNDKEAACFRLPVAK